MKLEVVLGQFLIQLEANGRSHHTQKQYSRHVRALLCWLKSNGLSREIRNIDHRTLGLFLASPDVRILADGKKKRETSTNALRSSLRVFFGYVRDAGLTRNNAVRLIRRAQCSAPPPCALGVTEQKRLMALLAQCKKPQAQRDRVLFGLMLYSGLRVGSAVAVEAEDVDLDRGELRLRSAKGNRSDLVILGREALVLLRGRIAMCASGPLFFGRNGRPITTRHAQRRFRAWASEARLHGAASCHSLRHTFAMGLYGRTSDIALVQRALGHRSIASTLVYAQAGEKRLRDALGG